MANKGEATSATEAQWQKAEHKAEHIAPSASAAAADDVTRQSRVESISMWALVIAIGLVGLGFLAGLLDWLFLKNVRFFPIFEPDFWKDGGSTIVLKNNGENITNRYSPNGEAVRNFLFSIAALIGAVFGLYQVHNFARRTRIMAQDALSRARDADTKIEQERNERFVRAAELLRDKDASVRMAGIYALERLATEEGADYTGIVINVLAGFVRERTNRVDYPSRPEHEFLPVLWPDDVPDNRTPDERVCHDTGGWAEPTEPVKAAVKALNNICTREIDGKRPAPAVDLRGAQLPRLEADGFVMRKWRMQNANLQGAGLHSANLQRAGLQGANLQGAGLVGANLQGAMLREANLQGAELGEANLQGAWLQRAKLQGAWLVGAHLQGAMLVGAHLQGAALVEANLQGAMLREANLQGARLGYAQDLTLDQLDVAFWPSAKGPANLPDYIDTKEFEKIDKRWCTDDKDPTKLHPDLLDDNGNYRGLPLDFRQEREMELGIRPADDEEE